MLRKIWKKLVLAEVEVLWQAFEILLGRRWTRILWAIFCIDLLIWIPGAFRNQHVDAFLHDLRLNLHRVDVGALLWIVRRQADIIIDLILLLLRKVRSDLFKLVRWVDEHLVLLEDRHILKDNNTLPPDLILHTSLVRIIKWISLVHSWCRLVCQAQPILTGVLGEHVLVLFRVISLDLTIELHFINQIISDNSFHIWRRWRGRLFRFDDCITWDAISQHPIM